MRALPLIATVKPLEQPRRRFTEEEANRAVHYVGKVVYDLVVAHCQVSSIRCQIEGARGDKLEAFERDYRRLLGRVRELIHELDAVGVEVRDFEKGAVEFPALRDGKPAHLAWALGMGRVQWPTPVEEQAAMSGAMAMARS